MEASEDFLPSGKDAVSDDGMEPWRRRISDALKASKKTMKAVSLEAGLSASYVRDVIERGRNPKIDTMKKIASVLGVTVEWITTGREAEHSSTAQTSRALVKNIPVRGQAAAGRWMEFDDATITYAEIPSVSTQFDGDQFAVQIVGSSMDRLRIMDGDYVICVPFWGNVRAPRTGDIVVVERRRGQTFQRLVKEVVIKADTIELWPRSSDPRHQTPIIIDPASYQEGDGTTVEFVGLVRAIHVPMTDR